MKNEALLIGVDGGGTKTDVCVARTDGSVVRMRRLPGTNPSEIGVDAAFARLSAALRGFEGAAALHAGIAGAASPSTAAALKEKIQTAFPGIGRVAVQSDAFNALNGEVGLSDGIAVIAGTGASAFVRKGGQAARIGGWGFLVDDAGGGFSLGQACLRAAYRALDGRGEETILRHRVEEILGATLEDAIPDLYAGGAARVASFAPVAFDAARAGDPVAAGLVENCADEIAGLVSACARRFGPGRAICVLSGGMFHDFGFLMRVLQRTEPLGLDIRRPALAPVYGALAAAAALVGIEAGEPFRKNYVRTVTL